MKDLIFAAMALLIAWGVETSLSDEQKPPYSDQYTDECRDARRDGKQWYLDKYCHD